MQNLSPGASWLGFAEKPETRHNREAATAPLRGEAARPVKLKSSTFPGKTYNSVESVQDFFKRKGAAGRVGASHSGKTAGGGREAREVRPGDHRVGARVSHARYGTGGHPSD